VFVVRLDVSRLTRAERLGAAVGALRAVDVLGGEFRAAGPVDVKRRWVEEVFADPGMARAGGGPFPGVHCARRGRVSSVAAAGAPPGRTVVFTFAARPSTDAELAVLCGWGARLGGWPEGSRAVSGRVHDGAMLMMAVAALRVHDPVRAGIFLEVLREVGLRVPVPAGGWGAA
jgi:hypothetical protein